MLPFHLIGIFLCPYSLVNVTLLFLIREPKVTRLKINGNVHRTLMKYSNRGRLCWMARYCLRAAVTTLLNPNLKEEILVRNSSIFTINIPEANRYGAPPGSYPAVVDGYYFSLKSTASRRTYTEIFYSP